MVRNPQEKDEGLTRSKIIDRVIEVSIGMVVASGVAVLSGLRNDINKLNVTMAASIERANDDHDRLGETIKFGKELDARVRTLEIQCVKKPDFIRR